MKKKTISSVLLIAVCMSLLLSACTESKGKQKTNSSATLENNGISYNVIAEKEYEEIKEYIYSIEVLDEPWLSERQYFHVADAVDQIVTIELGGVPVLISECAKLQENTEDPEIHISDAWEIAVMALLRVDVSDHFSFFSTGSISEKISNFKSYAEQTLRDTASSDLSFDEKLNVYRKFGIFALPYVIDETEDGNSEYERYFILIGAHLSTAEYCKLTASTIPDTPPPSDEQQVAALLSSEKKLAEDFDYKVWLEENEEDLNNLFKFLDAYCAEYEAEQSE